MTFGEGKHYCRMKGTRMRRTCCFPRTSSKTFHPLKQIQEMTGSSGISRPGPVHALSSLRIEFSTIQKKCRFYSLGVPINNEASVILLFGGLLLSEKCETLK